MKNFEKKKIENRNRYFFPFFLYLPLKPFLFVIFYRFFFKFFSGIAWDPDTVEEQLCFGHAPADGCVYVQHRRPGRPDRHAAAPGDRRDHRTSGVRPVQDVPANGHGNAVHQLPRLDGSAYRRHHRPVASHHAASFVG